MRRGFLASALLTTFVVAYGATLTLAFHNAAFLTEPGDRLIVIFPPGTSMPSALERMGAAGTVVVGDGAAGSIYRAEVIEQAAAERLTSQAWVMREPGKPYFQGCIPVPPERERASKVW